jgi:hypothetical protein
VRPWRPDLAPFLLHISVFATSFLSQNFASGGRAHRGALSLRFQRTVAELCCRWASPPGARRAATGEPTGELFAASLIMNVVRFG